jgi:O-antigen/teichoic acid export membrane protein
VSVFKQWPIYFIGRMLPAVISFFAIATYTRVVDPKSFGIYALLMSVSLLIGTGCYSWLRVATLRMVGSVDDPADLASYMATILAGFVALSMLVAVMIVVVVRVLSPQLPVSSVLLAIGTAIASGWFELNVTLAQARLKLKLYGILQAARAVCTFGCSIGLIAAGFKVDALLGGFVVGNASVLLASGPWLSVLLGRMDGKIARRMLRFGWPSSAVSLSSFSGTFQRLVIDRIGGSAGVGIFSAASDFAGQSIGLLIGTALIAGQSLAFQARDRGSADELVSQMRNNARLVFAVGLGATAGMIALAEPLANAYFGPDFRAQAAPIIMISAAAVFVAGLRSSYFEQIFEIVLDTRPIAVLTACRVVLTVGLSVALIVHFGGVGAASASLITETLTLVAAAIWARRLIDLPLPYDTFAKLAAAAAAMIGVLQFVPNRHGLVGPAAAVVAGVLVYGSVAALLHMPALRARWRLTRAAETMAANP